MNILNQHSEQRQRTTNVCGGAARKLRTTLLGTLLLLAFASQAVAQSDKPYIIFREVSGTMHYLAHVYNSGTGDYELQDATTIGPDCIWLSGPDINPAGTNHNYYFYDGANYRFLSAPLAASGTISLSASQPGTALLRNTDQVYYFYDWDRVYSTGIGGVARGQQLFVADAAQCSAAGGSWEGGSVNECWKVFWVEYDGGSWQLSSVSSYNHTTNWGAFAPATITEHAKEVTATSSGALTLADFDMTYSASPLASHALSAGATSYSYTYRPAYTVYTYLGDDHYYYGGTEHNAIPDLASESSLTPTAYEWTLTGDGAAYLSFATTAGTTTSTSENPTLYYVTANNSGHTTATLTLTVTYSGGTTQSVSAIVTVATPCQNPAQATEPVVTYEDVTVSWIPTADKYKVEWQQSGDATWSEAEVVGDASYTITGLDYNTTYNYRVTAYCNGAYSEAPTGSLVYSFTTTDEPGMVIYGAVFGGGRMAPVTGKTEVIVINCDSISAVFGGNDIAGSVGGNDPNMGSTITLGVNSGDAYDSYGTTSAAIGVTIGSVYGGGNGYYAYNGTSFVAASSSFTSQTVADGASVMAMTPDHTVSTEAAWTNNTGGNYTLDFPAMNKTVVVVANDYVVVDSIFGGAKNAFVWNNSGDVTSVTINGGTVYSVFGGNNFGGTQGYGHHHVEVNGTKTDLTASYGTNGTRTGLGRDYGIRYLFGGGNKVAGSTTDVLVYGGQVDTLFGGGNNADVYAANITVDCALGAGSGNYTFGSAYTKALSAYAAGTPPTLTIDENYTWDGTGIYNVRTLFGGNNAANMAGVPTINLTSGSVGTAYGGGNAGDMLAAETDDGTGTDLVINDNNVHYGTHIVLNSASMLVDNLYGGCQMSSVDYSTWVELKEGHVGTVYGGCNVSGDVGSTRVNPTAAGPSSLDYQAVYGATYVVGTGGTVHKNLFAGSNGYYHCNNNIQYISGINFDDPEGNYIGMEIPTHNETNVIIDGDITVKNNVYAGGNMACVGFDNTSVGSKPFPQFVGLASVRVNSGTVEGAVYGGGNMADIIGNNEVIVTGGTIGNLYGGNDRAGSVAAITNRVLPASYGYASDGITPLTTVDSYISLTGAPTIGTVYGGGNGAYTYDAEHFCDPSDKPIQASTFVDIGITGGEGGGQIGTVFGGGDGVHVKNSIVIMLNSVKPGGVAAINNVGTIFGGNNLSDMIVEGSSSVVPDIILLHGQVGTVYGGCNKGQMQTSTTVTSGSDTYENVGSYVRLRETYTVGSAAPITCDAVVTDAVYGGCRMNDVTNNSLVIVEGGTHNADIFGGCDISGNAATTRVVVKGGTSNSVFGGGNGDYAYGTGDEYEGYDKPGSGHSYVDVTGGTCNNVYGGGNAAGVAASTVTMTDGTVTTGIYGGCNSSGTVTGAVILNIEGGTVGTAGAITNDGIYGGGFGPATATGDDVTVNIGATDGNSGPTLYCDVYGGSAQGTVNASTANTTTVNINGGTVNGNVYGGGLGVASLDGNGYRDESAPMTEAFVNGNVQVNVGNVTGTGPTFVVGTVFGCNNLAGTPLGTVNVDVYKTAHTTSPDNRYPDPVPTSVTDASFTSQEAYAIDAVYGGGNLAPYAPTAAAAPVVHIHNCDNTIQYVYGGGNAAAVPATDVTIDGGRIEWVFGGGNGAGTGNPGANVTGDVTVLIYGGLIDYLFGGSNTKGLISGSTTISYDDNACARLIKEVYGGGNEAPSNDITINIPCGAEGIYQFFGGARNADVGSAETPGNVTLNVYGGEFEELFGGNNLGGTIYGNVTLNIYGGDIGSAYGGNNQGGVIMGNIVVNVIMDTAVCPSQMRLINVFGGGKDAKYGCGGSGCATGEPSYHGNYPQVNIIRGVVEQNVFGGGLGEPATVYGNPQVTIGGGTTVIPSRTTPYTTETPSPSPAYYWPKVGLDGTTQGAVYGGGSQAAVQGTTNVKVIRAATINGNVYGGGLGSTATVSGSTNVQIGD